MPEWLVLTLAMLAACAVVVIITFVRHRAAPDDEDPNETPDVIEYMTMWIGVVYAIVLGLAIAGVWEGRSAAQDHVQAEATALHEISERVRVYPAEERERIRDDIRTYVSHVVTTEWDTMADKGEVTPAAPSSSSGSARTSPTTNRRRTSRRRPTSRCWTR